MLFVRQALSGNHLLINRYRVETTLDCRANIWKMSPVVSRNRMRTRSVSRGDTSDSSMMKSPLKHQHLGRRQSQVDDDTIMTPRELARTIAEFRVGLSSSLSTSTNDSNDMEDYKNTDADNQMDTHLEKDEIASGSDQSLVTPPPVFKSTSSYEPSSENPPINHTQPPNAMPYSFQTTQPDDSGNASSEEPTSRPPTGSHRRGFTSSEKELLEAAFHISDNPGTATMKLLVHLTGLDTKKIRGWFRTRRIRQEKEEAKAESSENTPPVTEPKHQVPPQYWPEPLRFSHMQRPYPVPGHHYRAPPGLTAMASGTPSMSSTLPSKVPSGFLYPALPPSAVPTMGLLPPPPTQWYPPLGFNTGPPPQPSISSEGQLPSGLPSTSNTTPTTGAPKAPTGPWYPSPNTGHPLQGVIPPSIPTPAGFLHPWSSVGCYGAQGVTPQHPSVPPFLSHPAVPYCNPWYPMLPTPNFQNPVHRQIGARAETSVMNITSASSTVKPISSQVTCTRQEPSGVESEASSTA
ncbi:formin-like protein 14 [Strongylocentrotus purpuratus]|uniref:Homeobox domain-containing protein n=1 Tax=Strongylocentrotus purpuratus TaxID=7668 RepID=A0A7M7HJM0_STRPU|nr:formin-like protein 14 [Strongylocentrotus purpuratus]|eukprot:XP_011664857.1 PREDICTED: formin-like protein 14 [Strongylocentrotus purpuratus]